MQKTSQKLMAPLFAASIVMSSLALAGCEEDGPAEEVGEKIDESVNDAKRAVEDADGPLRLRGLINPVPSTGQTNPDHKGDETWRAKAKP